MSTDQPRDTLDARPSAPPVPLAPLWHTAILVTLILAVAVTGTFVRPSVATPQAPSSGVARITAVYLPMVIVQWGLALYVCRVARPRSALGSLLGERLRGPRRALVAGVIALVGWGLIQGVELVWARLFGASAAASVVALLPQTWSERLAWVVVAVSAGFCEEVVYRGYLQTQLAAFTGRANVAVVLQAALFGIAHGEQGGRAVARVALYGLAFGALARWRRSLWPGIACHVWTDLATGLLR